MPAIQCEVCGRSVPQPKRGYRLYHAPCKTLRDDMERVRKHLEAIAEGEGPDLDPQHLAEIRYDMFCMTSLVPRARDERGRYLSSGASPAYDAMVARRREQRERLEAEHAPSPAPLALTVDQLVAAVDAPIYARVSPRRQRSASPTPSPVRRNVPYTDDPQLLDIEDASPARRLA